MSTSTPGSALAVTAVAAATALLLVGAHLWAPALGTVPGRVLPGSDAAGAGGEGEDQVVLRPRVLRSQEGRAEVDVVVGAAAPGDVVVDLGLAEPVVAPDGTVTPGAAAAEGRVTGGGRVRPGELLRTTVSDVTGPVVVVATVHPVGGDASTAATTTLAALVLAGPVGPPPEVALEEVDGELQGTITSGAPLLVTARLRGGQVVSHPERLVLPDQPVVLAGTPARWPAPSELVVTDEAGRTTTVSTGATSLILLAVVLVLAAVAGVALLVRRRRRTTAT